MIYLSQEQEKRANQLHKNSIFFDAHCDSILSVLAGERSLCQRSELGHLDIPRLKEGGVDVQVFSIFVRPDWYHDAVHATLKGIAVLKKELLRCPRNVLFVSNSSGAQRAVEEGRIAALLSIEGGEALQGDLDMLSIYHELGVSSLILTWNHRNAIADGALDLRSGGGLSDFGVEVVKEMERLGMVVDLAHISPNGFWDVMEVSEKPLIVSHTLPRSFMDTPRNLDDEQIKAIADKGGVIGVTFYFSSYGGKQGSVETLLDVIDYFVKLAGIDHVGIGSDFDGYSGQVIGLESCKDMINITRGLVYRGYTDEDIEKILGKNFMRVFREVTG